ncbi:MAG: signal peptide peptidase SppA [Deltaproteobacteria bacterium]|jgi:protease-4|nr:signal peptide peptidase SppA [Deltaproteobacteria bacterium]
MVILLLLFSTGCSFVIPISGVRPLAEKTVGGEGRDKILLIDISGMISGKKRSAALGLTERPSLVEQVKEALDKAEKDGAVKAVILRINSHGGTVTASDIIHHEIKGYKERTGAVVIAEMLDVAASGGYYIATAADTIIAHPTTVTGSIGVVLFKLNVEGLMEKVGLEEESIKSGDMKDIGSPFRGMTSEEREILQGVIDTMYERFLDVVADGRKIERRKLREIADGRIYTARQALDLNLIDEIGYLDDAIEEAKKAAGLEEARVVTYGRPSDYRGSIYSLSDLNLSVMSNLIGIDGEELMERLSMSFMYRWMP